jgi:hypothetical protein
MTYVFFARDFCMWNITGLDYEAPLFANAEAREGAGVAPMLWAKWTQRGKAGASRSLKGGRAGHYSAKRIFEMRLMNLVVQQTAIPVSEAQQIAALAVKGPWNIQELAAEPEPTNWRSYVLRESRPPLDVCLIYSKTENCWGYDLSLGVPANLNFKNSASLVLAAARELTTVSKYCWSLLLEGRSAAVHKK